MRLTDFVFISINLHYGRTVVKTFFIFFEIFQIGMSDPPSLPV